MQHIHAHIYVYVVKYTTLYYLHLFCRLASSYSSPGQHERSLERLYIEVIYHEVSLVKNIIYTQCILMV